MEIGPGENPLQIAEGASVRYVDYQPIEQIRKTYANIPDIYVPGEIIDDGDTLSSIGEKSVNFIAAFTCSNTRKIRSAFF